MVADNEKIENGDVRTWSDLIRDIDSRLRVIERLVYVAVGGTIVIGALASIGIGMLVKQSERVDNIVIKQASAIAERHAHIEALKVEIARLRNARP